MGAAQSGRRVRMKPRARRNTDHRRTALRAILIDMPARGHARIERNQSPRLHTCRTSNIELNPRRVSSGFLEDPIDQWEQEGRPGVSPVDRQYSLDELPKMATEWLLTRNTLQ